MSDDKKGLISGQDQALYFNQEGLISGQDQSFLLGKTNLTREHHSKPASKKERAFMFLLEHPFGITENEVLFHCRLSSGRNYPNELERKLNIVLGREGIPNPDGIGKHLKYWITNREDAMKVLSVINVMRLDRGCEGFTELEIESLISLYPDITGEVA